MKLNFDSSLGRETVELDRLEAKSISLYAPTYTWYASRSLRLSQHGNRYLCFII